MNMSTLYQKYEITLPTPDPDDKDFMDFLHENDIQSVRRPDAHNEFTYLGDQDDLALLIIRWFACTVSPDEITLAE